jgi:hypothetical protein
MGSVSLMGWKKLIADLPICGNKEFSPQHVVAGYYKP